MNTVQDTFRDLQREIIGTVSSYKCLTSTLNSSSKASPTCWRVGHWFLAGEARAEVARRVRRMNMVSGVCLVAECDGGPLYQHFYRQVEHRCSLIINIKRSLLCFPRLNNILYVNKDIKALLSATLVILQKT